MRVVWIGIAGAAGAISRYLLQGWINRWSDGAFPMGTFLVNISGCFLVGLLFTALTERFAVHPDVRTAATVGLLAAYTTYSTFALETFNLSEDGAIGLAILNVVASVAVGMVAVWLGVTIGRML
jgi:fluoride exporter